MHDTNKQDTFFEYRSDYEHYAVMNTTELVVEMRPDEIQARTGLKPMTSAIPLQRSTNWANKPTGSWSLCWFQINPWSDE